MKTNIATYSRKRKRPTVSNRKRREVERHQLNVEGQQQQHHQESEQEIELELAETANNTHDEEDENIQLSQFPGGPSSLQLLHSYADHVAMSIWNNEERGVIKCVNHTPLLHKWDISKDKISSKLMNFLESSKLKILRTISYLTVDKVLVNAFVERWHPETNSFHMPFGEMTLTLDDVSCITGLPICGRPILLDGNEANRHEMVKELLGVSTAEATNSMSDARGGSIKLEWLRTTFETKCASDRDNVCTNAARAYLLYLIGCTIFTDKTGSRVPALWLECLRDLENVHSYAWGAATLAFLYRQLGKASRASCKQISGFMSLLQAWIYERFPVFMPDHNVDYTSNLPRAAMWKPKGQGGSINQLKSYRERIDNLIRRDVNWTPYEVARERFPFHKISLFHGCISAGPVIEPYNPDRVLRQFGRIQTVPGTPIAHEIRSRSDKKNHEPLKLLMHYFSFWESHILAEEHLGNVAQPSHQVSDDYLNWFTLNSHPLVQNPDRRSFVFGRLFEEVDEVDTYNNSEFLKKLNSIRELVRPIRQRRMVSGNESVTLQEALDVIDNVYMIASKTSANVGR